MPIAHWMALAMLATAAAAAAETKPPPVDPADPAANAAPIRFASAFDGYRPMGEENAPPDDVWRAANDEMKGLGGHAGHIRNDAGAAPSAHEGHGPQHRREGK